MVLVIDKHKKPCNTISEAYGFEYCHIVQRSDGYLYNYNECDFLSAIHNRVSIAKIQ